LIEIDHSGAGTPPLQGIHSRLLGNIFKLEIPFVEVKAVPDHVTREENVLQPVIVYIPNGYSPAIIEIDIVGYIEGTVFKKGVLEIDACLVRVEPGEQFITAIPTGAQQEEAY
jgi:hypothetical protein